MDWLILIIGMVTGVLIFEFFKHFVLKRTGKWVVILLVLFVLFVVFSAVFVNTDTFKGSPIIQTGAAVANVFTKGGESVGNVTKDVSDKGSSFIDSSFKKE
jgi:phosphoglycerol transferase MdoB-like AlkP superfamily enzyme